MTNPGDALGAFTEVRLVHHAAVADLFSAKSADGRPVVIVALTPEAGADHAWRSAFHDLITRDRATVNPADPQYVVAHAGDLNGPRPWVANHFLPGRRGVERVLTVIPGGLPPGVDPSAMVGSALYGASGGMAAPASAPPAPWAAQPPASSAPPWAAQPPAQTAPPQTAPPQAAPPQAQPSPPQQPGQPTSPAPWTNPWADQAAAPAPAAPAPATPQWSTPPTQPATPTWSTPAEQPATPTWSTPAEQSATPPWSSSPEQPATPQWSTPSPPPLNPVSAAPQSSYPQAEYGVPAPGYPGEANPPGGSSPAPAYAGPAPYPAPAPAEPPARSRTGILIGLITLVTVLVMVGAGFAVLLHKNNSKDEKPNAAPPTVTASSPLPANTAGPSPTPSRSPLPSTTPTLRTAAKQISVVGPTWKAGDVTQLLTLTGWPFAFRMPEGWSCLRGTSTQVPDADVWGCVKTEGTSHQQRATAMLRRCPTTCTADEQATMNNAWFDADERGSIKNFDPTTYYVEVPKNDDGFYAIDFSHFYADKPGGTLTYEVGFWFQSPAKYKEEMQKTLNDIRSQAPQPS